MSLAAYVHGYLGLLLRKPIIVQALTLPMSAINHTTGHIMVMHVKPSCPPPLLFVRKT